MSAYILFLRKTFFLFLFIAGLSGSAVFFPLPLNSGHSCVFHKLCKKRQLIKKPKRRACFFTTRQTGIDSERPAQHNPLFKHYMRYYALPWWFSLALMAVGFWGFRYKGSIFRKTLK